MKTDSKGTSARSTSDDDDDNDDDDCLFVFITVCGNGRIAKQMSLTASL